jgi:translation initiation factor IF-1
VARDPVPGDPRPDGRVDVEVEGVVEAQLPSALYRVRLAAGKPGMVTAHLSADPRRNFVRILVGERVRVRLSPQDLTKGAIVARLG